jgi:aminomethyltransferase
MLKRTPLYDVHRISGARLVEFGGWEMPVQYTGIIDEHNAVRTAAGLFDIAHMGEVRVRGPVSLPFLNHVLTNNLSRLSPGHGQYTLMCNEAGGTIDDLYVYQLAPEEYLLIVNASRIEPDYAWLKEQFSRFPSSWQTEVVNESESLGAVAIQGPRVAEFIDRCFSSAASAAQSNPTALKKNQIAEFMFDRSPVQVARTGYTGEDGFEVVAPSSVLPELWMRLINAGQAYGIKPAGLGCRDTLRTEMGYPLYGHELDEHTSPLQAGLGRFVDLEKPDFIGRAALLAQKANGLNKKCIAFMMTEKSAPPRPRYPIWNEQATVRLGEVVSGTLSPSLGTGIGMGYIPPQHASPGTLLNIEIRGKFAPARIVTKPIYKPV